MSAEARRLRSRPWRGSARRALAMLGLWLAAGAAPAQQVPPDCIAGIANAAYASPTDRYPHGALGDPVEYAALTVTYRLTAPCQAGSARQSVTLPDSLVFEDIPRPRLADLDGDGAPEILTVEAHQQRGARVAIWARRGTGVQRIATTPYIGTRFRWLALIGAADLDGDGKIEIAYIDRPHLARILRIWRYHGGRLTEIASQPGLTNHPYGDPGIHGGIRDCGAGPEIVTADTSWSRIMAARLVGDRIETRDLGAYQGPQSLRAAMACR